jgi:hypothetical protein
MVVIAGGGDDGKIGWSRLHLGKSSEIVPPVANTRELAGVRCASRARWGPRQPATQALSELVQPERSVFLR